jgi:hypothetical protein
MDLDPAFHFDTDPDPVFQFDTDLDLTVWYRSGSLPFQRGNEPKTVLFIHLNLFFLVSRSNKAYFVKISFPVNFVVLIRELVYDVYWLLMFDVYGIKIPGTHFQDQDRTFTE